MAHLLALWAVTELGVVYGLFAMMLTHGLTSAFWTVGTVAASVVSGWLVRKYKG
jgi:hypothetical protein